MAPRPVTTSVLPSPSAHVPSYSLNRHKQYVWPTLWANAFPFNVGRTFHLNLMVLWLVLGFMGGTYYMVPEETGRKIFSPLLAYIQLGLLVVTGVAALAGFVAANFYPTLWLTEGREYIEAPRWADWLIVTAVVIFAFNVGMTILRRSRPVTATVGILAAGLVGLAAMYLVGMRFLPNVALDQFLWWWVIHLWVEGTWELIAASLMAFLLVKLTGVDRRVVEKWLYFEVGLVLFTGIIGTGHHYYWIGTPRYWLMLGAVVISLTVAGIAQVYLERMSGMDFMVVKTPYMTFWFVWRLVFGAIAVTGVVLYLVDMLSLGLGPEPRRAAGLRSEEPPVSLGLG